MCRILLKITTVPIHTTICRGLKEIVRILVGSIFALIAVIHNLLRFCWKDLSVDCSGSLRNKLFDKQQFHPFFTPS